MLSLLYGPTLTSVHDYWKDHTLDYTNFCQQSDIFAYYALFFKTPPKEQKNKKSSIAMLPYNLTRRLTSHKGLLVSDPVRTQKWG